ncbi:universal stress protein PHOS32-like [Benincasa hispida]|uniref:universal stress protein PHOS32-like n=1 Tax=Benincasa hispida TaxID=102211 RepID=UPI001901C3F4|nr:universal stress protein PHOS32-like [Benincasa hispida]
MGKTGAKLPSFCLNRIRPHVRVPIQSKPDSLSVKTGPNNKADDSVDDNNDHVGGAKPVLGIERKIMIVVDSTIEAEGALHWALSHTVQNQDNILLLHVIKPSTKGEGPSKETAPRAYELVHSMKTLCQLKRPEVETEVAVVEGGKEKGAVIVEEARKRGVSLLVLGQKKRSTTWRLLMVWAGHRWGGGGGGGGGGVVEYCIQNASCMAIAVRRKSKKLGGYLITTKRQKDFWLLA